MCLGWKDKRDVFLMGTCINDSLVTVKHMPPDPKLIIKCVDARFAATFGNRNSNLYQQNKFQPKCLDKALQA